MGIWKSTGNSGQTTKAAKTGNGRGRTAATKKAAELKQEEIGARYTKLKHECVSGPNGCDSPCPLA